MQELENLPLPPLPIRLINRWGTMVQNDELKVDKAMLLYMLETLKEVIIEENKI
jgi:hypothetical protein